MSCILSSKMYPHKNPAKSCWKTKQKQNKTKINKNIKKIQQQSKQKKMRKINKRKKKKEKLNKTKQLKKNRNKNYPPDLFHFSEWFFTYSLPASMPKIYVKKQLFSLGYLKQFLFYSFNFSNFSYEIIVKPVQIRHVI